MGSQHYGGAFPDGSVNVPGLCMVATLDDIERGGASTPVGMLKGQQMTSYSQRG